MLTGLYDSWPISSQSVREQHPMAQNITSSPRSLQPPRNQPLPSNTPSMKYLVLAWQFELDIDILSLPQAVRKKQYMPQMPFAVWRIYQKLDAGKSA